MLLPNQTATRAGLPYPLGATYCGDGVNFALFSAHATNVAVCLFDQNGQETCYLLTARTGDIHHGFIAGVGSQMRYGYRVWGEYCPEQGHYFNPNKLLLDPYAREIDGTVDLSNDEAAGWFHASDDRDNAAIAPKSVISAPSRYHWGDDQSPRIPWAETVIYEAHVQGFTKQFPRLSQAGTYADLAKPSVIKHLKSLGITTLELLPIYQHLDETHLQRNHLQNYWGYNPISTFAIEPRYAKDPQRAADEFRDAVKALHKAGIEVILDVVYNHTAEANCNGPMLCQRGIDNNSWYWSMPEFTEGYENWSGCGNTVRVEHPAVTRWVLDSLRYWVEKFHVDGFRFDLATILGREGAFRPDGKFFHALLQDPILSRVKLIAEPWDIGLGGYQVGHFPSPFAMWNDRFRDDMRDFWLGQNGNIRAFAQRFCGSSELFQRLGQAPSVGINFITAHDGFTLADLTRYEQKHNEANGEDNRDGHNDNRSNNHGVEGDTNDKAILNARQHSQKALLASLFLARGTPMLLAGDEIGNSQKGNNNSYCQANEISWLDWAKADKSLLSYVQKLTTLRHSNDNWLEDNDVRWLTADGTEMTVDDWQYPKHHGALQIQLGNRLIIINGKHAEQNFSLPEGEWQCQLEPMPSNISTVKNRLFYAPHLGFWLFQNINS